MIMSVVKWIIIKSFVEKIEGIFPDLKGDYSCFYRPGEAS